VGTERRRTWWGWVVPTAPVAALLVASAGFGITYNSTPSIPVGLYRIRPLEGEPARGDIVGVCLEGEITRLALERGYVHPRGLEHLIYRTWCDAGVAVIGKPVAGVPGDTVEIGGDGVRVNGQLLPCGAAPSHDRHGRSIPRVPSGRFVLGAEEYWLQSALMAHSLDSRVIGVVTLGQIRDRRTPLPTTSARRRGACSP
jgi:conjugative transfer signal peptidase TraF